MQTYTSAKNLTPLDNDRLLRLAPSIFAERPHEGVSERYEFFPTIEIVDGLRREGWYPVWAREQRVRLEGRRGFQKHMIRFSHADLAVGHWNIGDTLPQIVVTNAHDLSSAYHLHAALWRLVCGNGLMVDEGTFNRVSVRHTGRSVGDIIDASYEVISSVPAIADEVKTLQGRRLTDREQLAYAEAALVLKYDDAQTAPLNAEDLLRARRTADHEGTLWSTYNRVQENLIKGGQRNYSKRTASGRIAGRTRAVTGIDQDVKLNKALWTLAKALRDNSTTLALPEAA